MPVPHGPRLLTSRGEGDGGPLDGLPRRPVRRDTPGNRTPLWGQRRGQRAFPPGTQAIPDGSRGASGRERWVRQSGREAGEGPLAPSRAAGWTRRGQTATSWVGGADGKEGPLLQLQNESEYMSVGFAKRVKKGGQGAKKVGGHVCAGMKSTKKGRKKRPSRCTTTHCWKAPKTPLRRFCMRDEEEVDGRRDLSRSLGRGWLDAPVRKIEAVRRESERSE